MISTTNLNLAAMALVMILSRANAHLEINLVAGTHVKIPEQYKNQAGKDQTNILCRTAVVKANQQGRNPNDPYPGATCHGIPMLQDPKRLATLTAGGEFQWGIDKNKLGSGHDGGHCSWWVSDGVNQKKWYKFKDQIDCTDKEIAGVQPSKIRIPENLPLACKDACTLLWMWSPLHTGKCEIYSNCFDVKIAGVKGGIEEDYPMESEFKCLRANTATHKTATFGKFISVASDGAITLEQVDPGDQTCYQYTVRAGDDIREVRAKFDISAKDLYAKNSLGMTNEDTLPAAGKKLTIAGCDGTVAVVSTAGSLYVSAAVVLTIFMLSF